MEWWNESIKMIFQLGRKAFENHCCQKSNGQHWKRRKVGKVKKDSDAIKCKFQAQRSTLVHCQILGALV